MTRFTLRPATRTDGPASAQLFRRSRQAKLPYLPDLRTPDEDREHFTDQLPTECTVWLAETDRPVGFIAWRPGEVDHLYVDPHLIGHGIGSALIAKAMAAEPRLELWAFQRNTDAIRFYRRKGFVIVGETDGSRNEEKEPDVRLAWWRQ